MNTNEVKICGKIVLNPSYNHEKNGEKFYLIYIESERLSGQKDVLPVMLSEKYIDANKDYEGNAILIYGEYRSFNLVKDGKTHLILYIFAKEVECVSECYDQNEILLEGFICKKPICRVTPRGREIADILLAINRSHGKTSYIPCICWGRNALFAKHIEVGKKVVLQGRIQSREYTKVFLDKEVKKVAYEVSVSAIEVKEDEE